LLVVIYILLVHFWFFVKHIKQILYYFSKDGRSDHHGMNEIFKTNEIKKGDLDSIEKKFQVIKMKEYIEKRGVNGLKDEDTYVVRY